MNNFYTIAKKQIFPISLILILALARLIPHPINVALPIAQSNTVPTVKICFFIFLILLSYNKPYNYSPIKFLHSSSFAE